MSGALSATPGHQRRRSTESPRSHAHQSTGGHLMPEYWSAGALKHRGMERLSTKGAKAPRHQGSKAPRTPSTKGTGT
ncbi:UNVERIFIED_CONTAM: hypothetical protein FKN15_026319 [Acipenser sinensis]